MPTIVRLLHCCTVVRLFFSRLILSSALMDPNHLPSCLHHFGHRNSTMGWGATCFLRLLLLCVFVLLLCSLSLCLSCRAFLFLLFLLLLLWSCFCSPLAVVSDSDGDGRRSGPSSGQQDRRCLGAGSPKGDMPYRAEEVIYFYNTWGRFVLSQLLA